jgi:hypothetical protein
LLFCNPDLLDEVDAKAYIQNIKIPGKEKGNDEIAAWKRRFKFMVVFSAFGGRQLVVSISVLFYILSVVYSVPCSCGFAM